MTLNKVLKPTNTSSLQKHSVRSLSDMMGDFDSSDDENVENLPPLPNDQVSWEYWQCCHDADANGESSTLIGSTCLSSMLTKTMITILNSYLLFRLVSSALIGWTSLASGCTTLSPCPLFQAAGWFWWLSDRILFISNLGSSDSGSSEEILRKMWRWLPRLASQMSWSWCRCCTFTSCKPTILLPHWSS